MTNFSVHTLERDRAILLSTKWVNVMLRAQRPAILPEYICTEHKKCWSVRCCVLLCGRSSFTCVCQIVWVAILMIRPLESFILRSLMAAFEEGVGGRAHSCLLVLSEGFTCASLEAREVALN